MPESSTQVPKIMSGHAVTAIGAESGPVVHTTTEGGILAATTSITRNNVSVTSIKCEVDEMSATSLSCGNKDKVSNIVPVVKTTAGGNNYNGRRSSRSDDVRIPLSKVEDSDSEAELTNIENLKVTRRTTSSSATVGAAASSCYVNNIEPRPMSWEGELSEIETGEIEMMETENSLSNGMILLTKATSLSVGSKVIKSEATTTKSNKNHQDGINLVNQHPSTKRELEKISADMHNSAVAYAGTRFKLVQTQSDPINFKFEPETGLGTAATSACVNSPLLARNKPTNLPLPANPSPDSAIHSVYAHSSPSQSPLTSRHAPYTPSLSRNNSDASHSSCYSYSSEFSPTHSPIQGRHAQSNSAVYGNFNGSLHHSILYRPISVDGTAACANSETAQNLSSDTHASALGVGADANLPSSAVGISRQQLINSPCPICGDKISGFHYGIFSCESCKGFFKRTVQNRKNYVCVRGGPCPVSTSTRKKCPACRFEKCLQKGMKLEAIREDRTRGGRSTYQCSYTLPNSILGPLLSPDQQAAAAAVVIPQQQQQRLGSFGSAVGAANKGMDSFITTAGGGGSKQTIKTESDEIVGSGINNATHNARTNIPVLLQEIMDVEHLWQYNDSELARLNQPLFASSPTSSGMTTAETSKSGESLPSSNPSFATKQVTNPLLASAGLSSNGENTNPDLIAHLCNVADHRLYKIVKWCKSLPLFKNISIDDQICLLINSWCELLLFSCCFRSIDTPSEIKMSQGRKITLAQAKSSGVQACIERMLNLTDHLRRLRVDRYEYVAMKVIVLLQSDTSELREPVKVRECQENALQSLQAYTLAHYPDTPSKFGELLLRIPDLQRTCQLGKDMLTIKSRDGGDFNLLMELLRGEH